MNTELEILLQAAEVPSVIVEKINLALLHEYREGWKMGRRDMRQQVENALAKIRLEPDE